MSYKRKGAGMDIKTDLFLMGKKAEFIRQKILSSKKEVFGRNDLVLNEVERLVRNFNMTCFAVGLEVSVENIALLLFRRHSYSAEDLLYRIEAVLSVTNAAGELGDVETGEEEVQVMPSLGQEAEDDKREEYLGS
jgi:hypothetical protein